MEDGQAALPRRAQLFTRFRGLVSPVPDQQIVSLVLANNGLTSLLPLSPFHLTNYLPGILNVSLAGNSLRNMRDLDCLSPHVGKQRTDGQQKGWAQLRELVLIGNPLVVTGTGEAKYKRYVRPILA